MNLLVRGLGRVGGFGASVVVTGLANLITVPFVISHTGAGGWASVAVGQSLGSIVGIFTLLGWLQTGPTVVAQSKAACRGQYFAESAYVRVLSLLVTVPICAAASLLLSTESRVATFLSAAGMLAINLGASWFFIGEGNPRGLFIFDAIPRCLGILAGTLAIIRGGGVILYTALVLLGALVAAAISGFDVISRYGKGDFRGMRPRVIGATLLRQRHGIGTALLSSAYLSAPILVLQSLVPGGVPSFALADKIKQQALTAYRPISQAFQGWTPKGGVDVVQERVRKAFWTVMLLGVSGGTLFVVAFPWISRVLGAGEVEASLGLGITMGVAFGMNIWSLTLGVACLVPLGLERHITISAAIGLGATAALIVPLSLSFSGVGAASAVAVGQTCVALYQIFVLSRHFRIEGVYEIVRQ